MISYDYARVQALNVGGFRAYQAGRADLQFNRNLEEVRGSIHSHSGGQPPEPNQVQIAPQGGAPILPPPSGNPENIRKRLNESMRKRVIDSFMARNDMGGCPICTLEFEPGEQIVDLPCHITHSVHTACFEQYKDFHTKNNKTMLCPVCRQKVELNRVITLDRKSVV